MSHVEKRILRREEEKKILSSTEGFKTGKRYFERSGKKVTYCFSGLMELNSSLGWIGISAISFKSYSGTHTHIRL